MKGEFEITDSEFGTSAIKTFGYMPIATNDLYAPENDDYRQMPVTLIPYYAFANRGETEMCVWLLRK